MTCDGGHCFLRFEADDSNTLRLKFKSVYGFGQYGEIAVSLLISARATLLGGS